MKAATVISVTAAESSESVGGSGHAGYRAMHLLIDAAIPPTPVFRTAATERQYMAFLGDRLRRWLEATPPRVGMTAIQPPIVVVREKIVSGYILLAESHIAAHLDYETMVAHLDIFGCREFEAGVIVGSVERELKLAVVQSRVVDRGLEYLAHSGHDVAETAAIGGLP